MPDRRAISRPLVCYLVYRIVRRGPCQYRSDHGLIALRLSSGTHHLRVTRRLPLINSIAIAISGVTLLLALLVRYRGFGRPMR